MPNARGRSRLYMRSAALRKVGAKGRLEGLFPATSFSKPVRLIFLRPRREGVAHLPGERQSPAVSVRRKARIMENAASGDATASRGSVIPSIVMMVAPGSGSRSGPAGRDRPPSPLARPARMPAGEYQARGFPQARQGLAPDGRAGARAPRRARRGRRRRAARRAKGPAAPPRSAATPSSTCPPRTARGSGWLWGRSEPRRRDGSSWRRSMADALSHRQHHVEAGAQDVRLLARRRRAKPVLRPDAAAVRFDDLLGN